MKPTPAKENNMGTIPGWRDQPRSMRDMEESRARAERIYESHVAPLNKYVEELRDRGFGEVPYIDPLSGGLNSRILFLFEKPGPKSANLGSGFLSRNNDDPTAEAVWKFQTNLGFRYCDLVFWNSVPGWNGQRKIYKQERRRGGEALVDFIELLPDLEVIVFVGRSAQRAEKLILHKNLVFVRSLHPSPIVRARWPMRWQGIEESWAAAKTHLTS